MIILRNKEFSSKAQKLLRRKTDFIAGCESIAKSGRLPLISRVRGKVLDMDIISKGREAIKRYKPTNNIHDMVNTNNWLKGGKMWHGDRNFSAIDEETGEERLFSVNEIMTEEEYLERMYSEEQREFSSKAQKARRDKFDISVAKEMYGGTEGNTNDLDKLKRVGRRKAKQRTIRRKADGALHYNHSLEDLSNNTKNAILDASKGKEKALDEVRWRALLQRAVNAGNRNPKKFKSADKLLDKLDAIENKASRTAKLKTAGKIGLGAAALVGSGVVAKKIYDKKKKDDDSAKK